MNESPVKDILFILQDGPIGRIRYVAWVKHEILNSTNAMASI